MQSILEIKFSNIIAEIIIEHSELIFGVDKKDTAEAPVTKTQSTRTIARLPSSRRLVHCHVFTINQLYWLATYTLWCFRNIYFFLN